MVINPSTIVKLFTGIPLDNTYSDTLYFANPSAQLSWLNSLVPVKTFTAQMYQRVNLGVFEAKCKADDIYNCNYMAFQNTAYGNKWFFAFITKIEYINNNNTRVEFEIDVMQTWMFDVELEECFIERQHSRTDEIGDNILPEPVECGEYVFDNYAPIDNNYNHFAVLIMIADDIQETPFAVHTYDNVFAGGLIYGIDANVSDLSDQVTEILSTYIQKPEKILNIYMCPMSLLPYDQGGYEQGTVIQPGIHNQPRTITKDAVTTRTLFGTYTPRNKKLYTYPYNFYHVDNGDGNGMELRYEFFSNKTPKFVIEGCMTTPVQLRITPIQYKGAEEDRAQFLTIGNFPVCSWNYDTYRAWVAQNSVPLIIKGAVTGIAAIASIATGNVAAAGASAAGFASVVSQLMQGYQASIAAETTMGNMSSGNSNFANHKQIFCGCRAHIAEDYARMIDSFFDVYGYAYKKHGIPNRSSRPHWNYVKTNGAKILGQCPCDDLKKMCSIYDNGITFWKNPNEVGNYTYDNSPQ